MAVSLCDAPFTACLSTVSWYLPRECRGKNSCHFCQKIWVTLYNKTRTKKAIGKFKHYLPDYSAIEANTADRNCTTESRSAVRNKASTFWWCMTSAKTTSEPKDLKITGSGTGKNIPTSWLLFISLGVKPMPLHASARYWHAGFELTAGGETKTIFCSKQVAVTAYVFLSLSPG